MKKNSLYEVRKITSLKEMLEQSVEIYSEKNAFLVKKNRTDSYTGITYRQYGDDVRALGTAFIDIGICKGSKVAVVSENRYAWAVTYMAAVNGEGYIVPIDKELAAEDIMNLLKVSEASAVVYSKNVKKKLGNEFPENIKYAINMDSEDADENCGEISFDALIKKGNELLEQGDKRFDNVEIIPEESKILLFTSGTTAMSKGVLLSHKNIVTNLMSMCSMVYCGEKDVFLSVLPIHHTYECTCGFLAPIYRGSTIAYCDGLRYIANNLKEAQATMMLGVPAMFEAMHKRVISHLKKSGMEKKFKTGRFVTKSLAKVGIDKRREVFKDVIDSFGGKVRLFISGAASISMETQKFFEDIGIEFLQGYGITECSPIVALSRSKMFREGAAGIALPCMDVDVLMPNEEGVGEIICKGDNVMNGYYKNDEETQAAVENGWFRTGDLGYIDEDKYIYITGRKKNVIVTKNGKNIYPEELEAFINQNEYVKESLVYGKDEDGSGELVISAIIVPNYAAIESVLGKDVSEGKVHELMQSAVDAVNKRNPLYKYIRNVTVRNDDFKKTTTQKIKRYLEI